MANIELTAKQHNKIKRAVKSLNDVRSEIARENPYANINWYLEDNDNLNLMEAESHTEGEKANHDAVLYCYDLKCAGGGGW
jgi:hypothetical protein